VCPCCIFESITRVNLSGERFEFEPFESLIRGL
jgi:hypothetical protein